MKAIIITIGDEILIGQIVDSNSAWLGNQLTLMGIDVIFTQSVSDGKEDILSTIKNAVQVADLIVLTGGLGPTKDDVTKTAIAKYMKTNMYFDEQLYGDIKSYFKKLGFHLTESHKAQCYLPEGIQVLRNKMGTAPGMLFTREEKHILSMPGVPHEMKWIFEHSFKEAFLLKHKDDLQIAHRTIRTVGMGETRIEAKIQHIIDKMPPEIKVAFLPGVHQVKIRIVTKSQTNLLPDVERFKKEIVKELGDIVFGYEKTNIEEALRDKFIFNNKTLSTAESCTGGHIAHRITSVSGASDYYYGSIIAYQNSIKENLLNVNKETLLAHGAVSEQTVKEMLKGLLVRLGTDIGLAVSGIAGPSGGTPNKPVGTIWMAWGNNEIQHTEKLQLGKDRIKNIEYTTVVAMNRLRLFLTKV